MHIERMASAKHYNICGCILSQTAIEVVKHALLEVHRGVVVVDDPPGCHDLTQWRRKVKATTCFE